MKTFKRLTGIAALLLFAFYAQAQFTRSGSPASEKGSGQTNYNSDRQQDIILLEQKAKTMEKDFMSRNTDVFDKHKSEVLSLMNREIIRSTNDLAELKYKLKKLSGGPQSQEGRSLQIEINQMDGRLGRQKLIRNNVTGLTIEDLNADNTKELAALRGQYAQFISLMKTNQKSKQKGDSQSGSSSGSSHSTTTGTSSNSMYVSSSTSSSEKKEQELPDSYYRMKDRKAGETYLKMQKNTATALTTTSKELELAMNAGRTDETAKLQADVLERMASNISMDRKIVSQIEKGDLRYSGLNPGMIKNETKKKEALINKAKNLKLPAQKGQFFSAIYQYIQLLN